MSSKIWKEYVHHRIELLEGTSDKAPEAEDTNRESEELSDLLEVEQQSWCQTVDRCIAYTFESYCKLVLCGALQHTNTSKALVVTPESIKSSIKQLFNLSPESPGPPHDCERCFGCYDRHVQWYNRIGHRIYDLPGRCRRNLSYSRHKVVPCKLRPLDSMNEDVGTTTVDLSKYEYVAPLHKSAAISLNQVFST